MRRVEEHSRRNFLGMFGLVTACAIAGCMEDNNAEFAKSAPPGPPDPLAGLSFRERRERGQALEKARRAEEDKDKRKSSGKRAKSR